MAGAHIADPKNPKIKDVRFSALNNQTKTRQNEAKIPKKIPTTAKAKQGIVPLAAGKSTKLKNVLRHDYPLLAKGAS